MKTILTITAAALITGCTTTPAPHTSASTKLYGTCTTIHAQVAADSIELETALDRCVGHSLTSSRCGGILHSPARLSQKTRNTEAATLCIHAGYLPNRSTLIRNKRLVKKLKAYSARLDRFLGV